MIFRRIQRCRTKSALEVLPLMQDKVDMDEAERRLTKDGWTVVNANILLVATHSDFPETTLYKEGRLLIKTMDPKEAWRAAAKVYECATGLADDSGFDAYLAAGPAAIEASLVKPAA